MRRPWNAVDQIWQRAVTSLKTVSLLSDTRYSKVYTSKARVDEFDQRILKALRDQDDECMKEIDEFKFDEFGVLLFVLPLEKLFKHTVFTVERDGSNLIRKFEINLGRDFMQTKSLQVGNDLLIFFDGAPIQIAKLSLIDRQRGP